MLRHLRPVMNIMFHSDPDKHNAECYKVMVEGVDDTLIKAFGADTKPTIEKGDDGFIVRTIDNNPVSPIHPS